MLKRQATAPPDVAAKPGPSLADWNLLRSFIAVHETGTLTEAARRLGTTQPSIGRHVRELEGAVGEALFVRLPGRFKPTPRAEALYATVAAMKGAALDAEQLFAGSQERIVGTVRIAASEVYAYHVIAPLVAAMLAEKDELEIELAVSNQADNLLRRDADIAVRFFRPEQDDLIAAHVGTTELGLFVHESFIERFGEPTGFDLRDGAFATGYDREAAPLAPYLKDVATSVPVRFRMRSDAILARHAAMESGLGVAACLVDIAVDRPGLRRVLADRFGLRQEVWLCAHAELRRSASMRFVWGRLDKALRERLASRQPAA